MVWVYWRSKFLIYMPIGNGLAVIKGGYNFPPVAVDDNYTTTVGESKNFTPLSNDSDPDLFPTNGVLTIDSCDTVSSANNTVTLNPDKKTVTYSPRVGYYGTDTFKYKAFDSLSQSNEATVSIIVTCNPPIITDKKLNFNEGNDYVIDITNPAADPANIFFVGGLPDRDDNLMAQPIRIVAGSVSVAGTGISLLGSTDTTISLRCAAGSLIGGIASPISVTYTIINQCGLKSTATMNGFIDPPTKRRFVFDFDYLVLTYSFTDGDDLDTRTRIVDPNIGDFIGWGKSSSVTQNTKTLLQWGGDNTGTGEESCMFFTRELVSEFPTITNFTLDCRCMWFGTVGRQPVKIKAFLAKGGTTFKTGFSFGVNGASDSQTIASFQKIISYASKNAADDGVRLATLKYDINSVTGIFDSNDTTTP
jgi:hypothetical protein